MKLQHFPIGARFEYEGRVFVKTGPLTASSEQGGQQLIPRYAILKPMDVPETAAPGASVRKLDPRKVRKAFDAFYDECLKHVDPTAATALETARAAFIAALNQAR